MVLRKRLYYGFNGDHASAVPRGPRSVRRGPKMKPVEDDQICAFELLADVAGKLLEETESSASSNASQARDLLLLGIHLDEKKQKQVEDNNSKGSRSDCLDQGSCVEIPELVANELILRPTMAENDSVIHTSNITTSDDSKKVDCELKLGTCGTEQLENNLTVPKICSVKKSDLMINSDNNSVQLPLYRVSFPGASFLKHSNDIVNLGIRDDDDENSFRCNKLRTKIRALRPQPRNSYRRIRKMLTSKYRKMAPKLKDYDLLNTNEESKLSYRSRKMIHLRDRYHCEAPSKRRKLCGRSFVVAYDDDASSESISNSPEKIIKGKQCSLDTSLLGGNGMTSPVKVHRKPKDSKVKLSIKSFKVPELYIELPETATVASLKRTVMETVTAILGGGLRVGVMLQGKKVRDDNRTLQQTGISVGSNLDTLGFTLEPSCTPVATSPKDSPRSFQCDLEHNSLRSQGSPFFDSGASNTTYTTKMVDQHDKNKEIRPFVMSAGTLNNCNEMPDLKALVSLPEVNAEPLTVLPMNPKSKRCENSQRRARRPFSVAEVEALVEAVEIFGTGRWRDVKMRAFDNADHRTYVDLKDKWKTLVHTASISPQQRRGQPVPQELLDRVLCAHSYWTDQHLSKQHNKHHHAEPLKIMDAQGIGMEV